MAVYRIADLNIKINHTHEYLTRLCKDYIHEDQNASIDFEVSPSADDYDRDKENLEGFSDGYLESISVYRQIAKKLLEYDGIILHAAVISLDGRAYAFSAPSGTGKSTHIKLWKKAFGDRVKIVNGDKPLIRYIDGTLYAYGTPWCGKERYNANTKAPLDSVCFISRAKEILVERESSGLQTISSNTEVKIDTNANVAEIINVLKDTDMNNISPLIAFGTLQNLVDKVKK